VVSPSAPKNCFTLTAQRKSDSLKSAMHQNTPSRTCTLGDLLAHLFGQRGALALCPFHITAERCRETFEPAEDLVCGPAIRALAGTARFAPRGLRLASVLLLRAVAEGHKYDQECGAQALDALADVLSCEPDVLIRAEAVKAFEVDGTAALSARGRRLASWWSARRRAARGAPVLFSDDDPDLARLRPAILKQGGWGKTHSCGDAFKTLELAGAMQPVLAVTDLCKPGMECDAMAQALKANPATRGIPIMLFTAQWTPRIEPALRPGHLQAGLAKPCRVNELVTTIEMVLAGVCFA